MGTTGVAIAGWRFDGETKQGSQCCRRIPDGSDARGRTQLRALVVPPVLHLRPSVEEGRLPKLASEVDTDHAFDEVMRKKRSAEPVQHDRRISAMDGSAVIWVLASLARNAKRCSHSVAASDDRR